MPIDPFAALNAMLRAEVTRFSPQTRRTEQSGPQPVPQQTPVPQTAPADAESGGESPQAQVKAQAPVDPAA
ncbi:hypothetical protein [Streptomyces sp. RerS4]|uniref:hypothetical protein n=1 Tax=Streptomyces sp. RerS4 TaxID=2942449 RepID=UPI00201BADA2|nr:hypothetical protein [Streptomyces sp. RerS4]UQX01907.1 hypothetical protein M4D82_16380 [Streptomyces sp. RerS4]